MVRGKDTVVELEGVLHLDLVADFLEALNVLAVAVHAAGVARVVNVVVVWQLRVRVRRCGEAHRRGGHRYDGGLECPFHIHMWLLLAHSVIDKKTT